MGNVTIKDIAKLAGVSYSTVSRALSGSREISEATRQRIQKICRDQGYQANALARSLINKKTNVIGLIVPEVTNPFYSEVSLEIETYARQQGYNIMLCNSLNNPETTANLFDFLLSHRVDGIIQASSKIYSQDEMHKRSVSLPFVLIGTAPAECNTFLASASTDNYAGGRLAAKHLLSRGHKNVFYLGYRSGSTSHQLRLLGFSTAFQEAGLTPHILKNPHHGSSIDAGFELCKAAFQEDFKETALFAATDSMALGALKAAEEYGLSIPDDLSVLSYDNTIFASLPRISLTAVDQRIKELSKSAVDMVIRMIESKDSFAPKQMLIKPALVIRNSVKTIL